MNVKTAELKNRLSYYLRRVRAGDTVMVYDRDEPIAVLSSLESAGSWAREREIRIAAARKAGLELDLPLQSPAGALARLKPILAPDGRTDISTIDLVRGGRDY